MNNFKLENTTKDSCKIVFAFIKIVEAIQFFL